MVSVSVLDSKSPGDNIGNWLIAQRAVWWMMVGSYSLLSSISTFSTDLKRIRMPHTLFWDFRADKIITVYSMISEQMKLLQPVAQATVQV